MISKNILTSFLIENNISENKMLLIEDDIEKLIMSFQTITKEETHNEQVGTDIVYRVIIDQYNLNSELVKSISKKIEKELKIKLGREEKKLIKDVLDYGSKDSIENLKNKFEENFIDALNIIEANKIDLYLEAKEVFLDDWESADNNRKKDYLYGLILKLFHLNEMENITLLDVFNYNQEMLIKELDKEEISYLKVLCEKNVEKNNIDEISKQFYRKYKVILKRRIQKDSLNGDLSNILNVDEIDINFKKNKNILDRANDLKLFETEEYDAIYFKINQDSYNKFNDYEKFYDYILSYINEIYRVLSNNKVLSIKIENIYDENKKNLKWDLYSKLCIYGEHFIPVENPGRFYKPEEVASEMLQIYNINISDEEKKLLANYYKNKLEFKDLIGKINAGDKLINKKEYIDSFKISYFGFTFTDCIVLEREESFPNNELENINNSTELLLTFYKYRIDDRRIPCPECGGLKTMGNSFPEIGHRSWECRNEICPSRSKSNRGKRFSEKTNYMQWGSENKSESNNISKELIRKWRKDIVSIENEDEIYEMIIKYFSFPNENLLFINSGFVNEEYNREIVYLNNAFPSEFKYYESDIEIKDKSNNIYNNYFNNGPVVSNFIIDKQSSRSNILDSFIQNDSKNIKLINGDSFSVLNKISDNIISSAVTSPPYYNAREYSQWDNFYLYLYDMFNIIKQSFRTIEPGGVFLYNIGDISSNEKIIAKSVMGSKRIPLGAYSIYLFQQSGFEFVENIIWNKGETQSNRHKNDGKFTPHYQKPINSYEHMLIFKKPGKEIKVNRENINDEHVWKNNVVLFSPVIKINSKGENLYGHSAPYPKDIPRFVSKLFNYKGDIMLDPFSGSLTSSIESNKEDLIGVGIELSKEFVDLSVKRANERDIEIEIIK